MNYRATHLCDIDTEYWADIEANDAEHAAEVFAEFDCEQIADVSHHDVAVRDEDGNVTKWRVTIEISTDYYASPIAEGSEEE